MEFAVTLYIFLPVSLLQARCCHPVSFLGWLYFLSTGRDHDMVTRVKCHYCSEVGNHSIWGMSDLRMKSNSSNMIQISIARHQAHSSDNIWLGFLIIWRNQTWIGNTFPAGASCEIGWSWNLSWISVIPLDQRSRYCPCFRYRISWILTKTVFFPQVNIEWLIVFLTRMGCGRCALQDSHTETEPESETEHSRHPRILLPHSGQQSVGRV